MDYSESVQSQYDWSNIAPSKAIVKAIASIENVEEIDLPEVLDTTLYDHVDPEALDFLITDDGHILVSFTMGEYKVQINGGTLKISFS